MDTLKNKVALISGASRGLGFALARELGEKGMKLVITARGKERLEDSRKKLEKMGYDVVAEAGDVGCWKDAQRIVKRAEQEFRGIDLLINNAGVSMRGRFDEFSSSTYNRIISTNLNGGINMTLASIHCLKKSRGQILFISSVAGLHGFPGSAVYCASKGALKNLCESLRFELRSSGIHVGVVFLGHTEHDPEKRIYASHDTLVRSNRPETFSQQKAAQVILKMIKKRRRQLVTTPLGRLCFIAERLSPRLIENAVFFAQKKQLGLYKKCV